MPKPGDRVVVEGTKVGGARREGTLMELSGMLMKVRWNDGGETYMAPGAGAVSFLPATAKSRAASGPAKAKAKPSKAPAKGKKK